MALIEEREKDEPAEVREEDVAILEEREKELVNKNGVTVDLKELAKLEDPYGPEIRRRTEGREQPEELLGFIGDLEGQWGSRRKKRKIVDANVFGDALPNGWKVLIGMKKKQGQAWLFCRRLVSPTGKHFVSCKEVSSYLLSLTSPQDLKQQSSVPCTEDSMFDIKLVSENVVDIRSKTASPPLYVTLQSNGYESQQTPPCISQTIDHGTQVSLSNNVQSGDVQSALKCHKCSIPFNDKDGLLNHLVSCHKRKRRKAGAPIEDDIMVKDGKYECQFCNRMFHERNSYFGHVGIHVKNYVKSIGGSPSVVDKQKTCDLVSIGGVPVTVSDTLGSLEANADYVAITPNILASGGPNLCSIDCKVKVGSDGETHSDNCDKDQSNLAVNSEMSVGAYQNDKASTDRSSDKQDGIVHTTDDNYGEADEPADVFAVKPDFCPASEKMLSTNENSDLCGNSGEINAIECAVTGISSPPSVLIGNTETCLLPDSSQIDLGNNVNFGSGSDINYEGGTSENDLLAENKESLSNQNSEDRSLGNNSVEHSCYGDGVKNGENDELMVGSGSGHLDLDMDTEDDNQHTGNLKECSVVSHKEEDTSGIIADNRIVFVGSTLTDSKVERGSETSSCTPCGNQHAITTQNYMGGVFTGMINEAEVDLCSLEKAEVEVDAHFSIAQERQIKDSGHSYIENDEKVPSVTVLDPQETGGFLVERMCSLENSTGEVSTRTGEEPKGDQVTNSSNSFFTSRSTEMDLDATVMTNHEHGKISSAFSHIPSGNDKADRDFSNVLGAYNSFVENKKEQDPKSFLSGLSGNEHMHEVPINNVSSVSDGTATRQLPELGKVENSRTNKLILDFGSMTEINERFLDNVQHETVSEGSSPFSLWVEPTCAVDNRTSVYGSSRGMDQQERASENNSLNFVGLQQPFDGGYNLNKTCMNEQRYGAQHNETGLYSRNSESGREGVSHGNTLNLVGLQQQCGAGYNLNKPCQQNFGVQHNEPEAYSTSDEARRERVTYGNSLSLASVQQTCDTGYSLNKACLQRTCDAGYSLNKGYSGSLQGLSKLEVVEHSRDRDLMIGFGNSSSRHNQGVGTELLWRPTEGSILPGSLVDSSSSQAQSSGFYQAFDFLSDKSGNGLCTGNDKFDNMSSFEGLRSTSVEPMEFSFLTTQDSNAQLEDPKVLSYNTEMDQGYASSVWHQKETSLPNMMGGHVFTTLCVWCGNEFHQDSIGCEMQAGSIGYLCPTCKARMSGQFL